MSDATSFNSNRAHGTPSSTLAAFAIRFCPQAKRFHDRKKAKTMTVVAMKAVAHKLARAAYYMMRDGTTFDVSRCFA
jgi:hypothetical protein